MTNKFERVLSENEMERIIADLGIEPLFSYRYAACAIQDSVLERLAEQEPVAWLILDEDGNHDDLEPFFHGDRLSMTSLRIRKSGK